MKRNLPLLILLLLFMRVSFAQNSNLISLSGGLSTATIDERDTKASGWRIIGLYELKKNEGKWMQGFGIGYISLSGSETYTKPSGLGQSVEVTTDYKVSTIPVYWAPKFLLGKSESFKGYLNLMVGMQFSNFDAETDNLSATDASDAGFYGGAGLGLMYFIKEKYFINGGYEFSYLSNSFYSDGLMNSFAIGIGIRF